MHRAQPVWWAHLKGHAPQALHFFGSACDLLVGAVADPSPAADGLPAAPRAAGLLTVQQLVIGALVGFLALQLASRLTRRYKPVYSKREVANLLGTQKHVMGELLDRKVTLTPTLTLPLTLGT